MCDRKETGDTVSRADKIIKTVLSDISRRKDDGIKGLPTGFSELDKMLSGLSDGNLIVVAGHPGIGTTAFALRIAEYLGIDKNIPVLYFSMALGKERLLERMLLGRAGIDLHKARQGKLEGEDWNLLKRTASEISKKPIYFDDTSRLTPGELRNKVITLKSEKDIKCVIVDSLQLMRLEKKIDLHEEEFAEISRSLKLMALELNVPVFLLAQLSFDLIRQEEERAKPRLADFDEAIIAERYADVLMLINREGYYGYCPLDSKYTEIMITKNCNGPTGMVGLNFYEEFARFENIS
ncbi:MAG: hypothetical protein DRP65_07475 [Planctomycetota bacterium]|nr:MAG: hypothetical protein DRP65_07475 [Planctomycetota bacterium]